MSKSSFKKKLYLTIAASSFLFRNWTIRKKLYIGFASLILVLTLNVILTSYEISRLNVSQSKLSYLVYLDIMGIVTGCLFIWIISQSVLRPMRRIIKQLEEQDSLESLQHYCNDEIGQLARAVSYMKKKSRRTEGPADEKKLLLDAILHASMEGIFIIDQGGRLTSSSRGFKNITGIAKSSKEIQIVDVIKNLNLSNAVDQLSKMDQDSPFYTQRLIFKTLKGKEQTLECSICKVEGSDQETYIGIVKEITRRTRMRETFRKTFNPFLKK